MQDLGISGDLILQGVLFAQFAHYWSLYKKDILILRVYVFFLLFLTTLKSVQCLVILWSQNVEHFTDVGGAAGLFFNSWPAQINLTFVAFIAFYVQMFFCQRLWALSRNIYVVALVVILFLFALLASFVSVSGSNSVISCLIISTAVAIHLGTVFAGDLFLCGSITYFLLKHSKQVLPQTAGMLNAILKLTFQSAAPAAICALINLISSQASARSGGVNVGQMLAIIANSILPKLYAISAMWTLNSRKDIRLARSNGQTTSSTEGRLSGRRRANNVELGPLSGVPIQVRTQVQTIQRTDDMFSKSGMDAMSELDTDGERDSTKH
ncbi:hypothetical protein C8R45DRAFT_823996 [Mycena sanguinolenta]|nr:hypothetical protein C8R45DRAFT_823996 [Mycena sanguinolenta]